jgi:hypothetical protein
VHADGTSAQAPQRRLEDGLDGAQARLRLPAVEGASVVLEEQPEARPDDARVPWRGESRRGPKIRRARGRVKRTDAASSREGAAAPPAFLSPAAAGLYVRA